MEHVSMEHMSTERVSMECVSMALYVSKERVSMQGHVSTWGCVSMQGCVSTQGRVNTIVNPTHRIPSRLATLPWPPRKNPQYR